jgi:hypothetical protein
MFEQFEDAFPITGGNITDRIGVNAHGRIELGKFFGHPNGSRTRRGIDAHAKNRIDAHRNRSLNDLRAIGVEVFLIEMSMGVEERHKSKYEVGMMKYENRETKGVN